jgi:RNA polymerase sigma-70 factor (ECF subfamily)
MDDSKIIDLYWARSELAISATAQKYGTYCQTIAYRILNQTEDSEECVSDTWLKAWNAIPPARPDCLRAFVGKITRNLALNRLRQDHTMKRGGQVVAIALDELKECVSTGDSPEDALENKRISESVNRFLGTLSTEKRVAFVLRYWYLCPIEEIAQKMNLKEAKLKSMLFRLRKQLKTHLEQEDILL